MALSILISPRLELRILLHRGKRVLFLKLLRLELVHFFVSFLAVQRVISSVVIIAVVGPGILLPPVLLLLAA